MYVCLEQPTGSEKSTVIKICKECAAACSLTRNVGIKNKISRITLHVNTKGKYKDMKNKL